MSDERRLSPSGWRSGVMQKAQYFFGEVLTGAVWISGAEGSEDGGSTAVETRTDNIDDGDGQQRRRGIDGSDRRDEQQ
ncbi:hypothetical protein CPLU01_09256 [Colletotrichum plurivorum]|uniref:Uncharacterized protein n=1 Tax=Colletotrichum plurivorum TaxID=2175906 RepID=A0A8H6KA63_9PEZI|nr:hypothetical protein CPLU01_09256 [Colletotrichum plurivorum]